MSSPINSSPIPSSRVYNLPNALTAIRIVAIPAVVALVYGRNTAWNDFWAAALFGFAFWTDFFDGMIARRTKTITRLGKIMDPMADKLLVLAALLMLIHLHRVQVITAILLLSREIAVSGLRSLAGSEGIFIPSILSAKIKTWLEGFAIAFLLLGPENRWLGIEWMELGGVLLYAALALALWSAAIYFRNYYEGTVSDAAA
ncbi:MAG TPA: CDP-diacylglycerol--glycerol-3-phosphate 3-phosphatidyltransferase [Bdellovibrionota bacterium]|nr:CDP-diacylglycerol--glycerol-3-phosphate 3-phosphatidyltransferase [Bdellovibrionota bacterium]